MKLFDALVRTKLSGTQLAKVLKRRIIYLVQKINFLNYSIIELVIIISEVQLPKKKSFFERFIGVHNVNTGGLLTKIANDVANSRQKVSPLHKL